MKTKVRLLLQGLCCNHMQEKEEEENEEEEEEEEDDAGTKFLLASIL